MLRPPSLRSGGGRARKDRRPTRWPRRARTMRSASRSSSRRAKSRMSASTVRLGP